MADMINVSIGISFLAGMASFLSPCVFALVPAYVGYLSGRRINDLKTDDRPNHWSTFSHGLAFVLGFSAIFIGLGVTISFLGGLLYELKFWISRVGGIIVIFFGLHMTGILTIPFLYYDTRQGLKRTAPRNYLTSAMMGVFFSAGWSPCVGPILGSIYTVLLNDGSILFGLKMLTAYSTGLALPFLVFAIGVGWATSFVSKYGKLLKFIEPVMGLLHIILGIMLFMGTLDSLARFGLFIDFGL